MTAHLDEAALAQGWREYKDHGDLEARNRLVLHYTSLVRYVAAKVAGGLPSMVERDDLISYGTFGLLDAIEKYDLDKGVKFETYAVSRIRGSIIDELRSLDWVPRTVRAKARDVERVQAELQAELGRPAEDVEVAERLGITVPELWTLVSESAAPTVVGLEEHADGDDERMSAVDVAFDPASNPEDLFMASEISDLLAQAVNSMEERSKVILVLYYLQEMTLAEIGEVLGVTESRVCQLQSRALHGLRGVLGQGALAA
jgi:RNA polymerase sigma factor for flagellar operon FliA